MKGQEAEDSGLYALRCTIKRDTQKRKSNPQCSGHCCGVCEDLLNESVRAQFLPPMEKWPGWRWEFSICWHAANSARSGCSQGWTSWSRNLVSWEILFPLSAGVSKEPFITSGYLSLRAKTWCPPLKVKGIWSFFNLHSNSWEHSAPRHQQKSGQFCSFVCSFLDLFFLRISSFHSLIGTVQSFIDSKINFMFPWLHFLWDHCI